MSFGGDLHVNICKRKAKESKQQGQDPNPHSACILEFATGTKRLLYCYMIAFGCASANRSGDRRKNSSFSWGFCLV